jgi:hypothetical protein
VQQVAGDAVGAGDHHVRPGRGGPVVHVAPRAGGEHRQQAGEVTVRRGGDELVGDLAVLGGGDVEAGAPVTGGDLLPGPGGELPARRGGAADRLRNGVERHAEDVVQDEDDPLGWGEPLQHHQQGQMHALVERDPVGGIGQGGLSRRGGGLDDAGVVGPLPAGPGRLDLVQAQAAGHHDQPAALICDLTRGGVQHAGKRVLHDVLGGADVPEHPERQINQVGAVLPVRPADRAAVLLTRHAASSRWHRPVPAVCGGAWRQLTLLLDETRQPNVTWPGGVGTASHSGLAPRPCR